LKIQDAVPDPIAPDRLVQNLLQGGGAHRDRDREFHEAPVEPSDVPVEVAQPAVENAPDLIDCVSELIATVFYVNRSLPVRLILSVDVGDP
jgi:hypothetical protein